MHYLYILSYLNIKINIDNGNLPGTTGGGAISIVWYLSYLSALLSGG